MGCDPKLVTGYVDGELSRYLAGRIRQHVSVCRACAAQVGFEMSLGALLRAHPETLPRAWGTHDTSAAGSAFSLQ